jgi:hypothetical protein
LRLVRVVVHTALLLLSVVCSSLRRTQGGASAHSAQCLQPLHSTSKLLATTADPVASTWMEGFCCAGFCCMCHVASSLTGISKHTWFHLPAVWRGTSRFQ